MHKNYNEKLLVEIDIERLKREEQRKEEEKNEKEQAMIRIR
jgi:hypothetical protein